MTRRWWGKTAIFLSSLKSSPFLLFLLQIQAKSASPANSAENSPVNSATALKNRPLSVMVTGKGTVLQKAKVMCQLVRDKNPVGTAAAFPPWQWWDGLEGRSDIWEAPLTKHDLEQASLVFLQSFQPGFALAVI